jgi:hypothetical protein
MEIVVAGAKISIKYDPSLLGKEFGSEIFDVCISLLDDLKQLEQFIDEIDVTPTQSLLHDSTAFMVSLSGSLPLDKQLLIPAKHISWSKNEKQREKDKADFSTFIIDAFISSATQYLVELGSAMQVVSKFRDALRSPRSPNLSGRA